MVYTTNGTLIQLEHLCWQLAFLQIHVLTCFLMKAGRKTINREQRTVVREQLAKSKEHFVNLAEVQIDSVSDFFFFKHNNNQTSEKTEYFFELQK